MKIEKLYLENFKCFSKADIDFGKITLLTGANSSGKSSIMYAILGAIQSNEFPLQFSPNGKYVNMGDYKQMVFRNDESKNIRIDLKVSLQKKEELNTHKISTLWELGKFNIPDIVGLELKSKNATLSINKQKDSTLNLNYNPRENYIPKEDDISLMTGLFNLIFKDNDDAEIRNIFADGADYAKKVLTQLSISNKEYDTFEAIKKDNTSLFLFIEEIKDSFDKIIDYLNFISPFRLHPERTYYERTQSEFRVGKFGENYIDQLLLWESQNAPEFEEVAKILKELNLVSEIQSNRIAGGRFELLVKTAPHSVWSSLSDVGFGISQFMPVIVADTQLGEGSTLFLAQPEIHLHPSVQADLGTYFVNQANEKDKNYVIETHSEYVLNRIRLEIAKGTIAEEDVKIYFLENDGQEATAHRLNFAKNGQIENAPANFFQTYMMDVMDIALTAE